MQAEWRWLITIMVTLILIAFLPYGWVALELNRDPGQAFMGTLHHYETGAAHLSRMSQGAQANGLVHFQHTPDPHQSALVQPIYIALGQLSRLTSIPEVMLFHTARLFAAFFMFPALYHMGASIWVKVRSRRIFFVLAAIGSGLGWLLLPFLLDQPLPDLALGQFSPFYSMVVNIHFPLAIACMALIVAELVKAMRPGVLDEPGVNNGGGILVLTSIALAFLYPEATLPLIVAMGLCIVLEWSIKRQVSTRELRWWLWLIIPTLPVVAYYLITLNENPAMNIWLQQRTLPSPSPVAMLAAFGIPGIIALPGLLRAVRRFEADGDRFILLWLIVMVVCVYLPLPVTQHFLAGFMIPIAYFATRSVEDVWLRRIARRRRPLLFVFFVPLIAISNLVVVFVPVSELLLPAPVDGMVLETDYVAAFSWLEDHINTEDVVLASPHVSSWVPYWTGARTYYGHPAETLMAQERRAATRAWYRSTEPDDAACDLTQQVQPGLEDNFTVRYVLMGPRERQMGDAACASDLQFVASFNRVTIYATRFVALPDN